MRKGEVRGSHRAKTAKGGPPAAPVPEGRPRIARQFHWRVSPARRNLRAGGTIEKSARRAYCIYKTVSTVEFTWDERKNQANRRKHRVSFDTAVLVFDDPFHISVQDREVEGEARWQTIGMAPGLQLLLVAHTVDEETETVRILSARKATRRERSIYEKSI